MTNISNLVFLSIILVVFIYFYMLYVSLIKKRNKLKEASADVDVQLKKRYDLIPNILQMAAKFMAHEKELLTQIVNLRNDAVKQNFSTDPQTQMDVEHALNSKLKDFWLNVENYPDLKSNQTMVQAMQTFNVAEEHIAAAHRFYNAAVTDLKNAVEIFPSSLIASIFNIKADMPFFQAEEAEKKRIDSKDFFK
ncbi:MAG: LemA family protein [Alphaproteobacteria bacterium]|nr:LemA family protein [Alphaproteobacteria bacterium]